MNYFALATALTRAEAAPTLAKLATKHKAIQRIANYEETMPDIATILKNTSAATDTAPRARVRRILDECVGSDLSSFEKHELLPSFANRFVLTEKQEKCLAAIEARVFEVDP